MHLLTLLSFRLNPSRLNDDKRGQDLIEYALMAGFVAVAAGAVMPGVSTSISTIFSKVKSALESGAGAGS